MVATFQVGRIPKDPAPHGGGIAIGWATSTDAGKHWRAGTLALRLRLPAGRRIVAVHPAHRFDAATGTIDLTGGRGHVTLVVETT